MFLGEINLFTYNNILSFSYLNDDLGLFKDREDPCAVYVIIKNKMHECILKDFHLHNAISLAGRLYNALPDQYLNARHYVDEVRKVLQTKVGDHTFTRKMGMNVCSMLLNAFTYKLVYLFHH